MKCVDAGNVLVHLFLQSKTHYRLTNTKLQYLLIVAQWSRLAYGRALFRDDVRNFKSGFVLDAIGNSFMTGCDIVPGVTNDMPINENMAGFVLPYSNKKIYEISKMPSAEDAELLMKVYLAFGAYHENTLCRLLNEFIPLRRVQAYSVVPAKLVCMFFPAAFETTKYDGNAVYRFIKAQNPYWVPKPEVEDAVPEETFELPPAPVPLALPAPRPLLCKFPSLQNIVAGEKYSVLVEFPYSNFDCRVEVLATATNQALPLEREMVTDTVCSFTFEAVASDIKISVRVPD